MNTINSRRNGTRSIAQEWIQHKVVRAAALPVVEGLETRTLMFAPSDMSATGTSASSISLNWTDNASNETHFIVDRSVDGVKYKRIGSVPANSTSFPDTGLEAGTQYHYRVKAITTTVNSGWSRVSGSTLTTSPVTAPAAPSGMAASSSASTTMNVSWSDNADNETHFLLERSTDATHYKRIASLGADTTNFLDSGLKAGTQYHYRIRSVNGIGGSKFVRTSGSTLAVDAPPGAPSGLAASSDSMTQIKLTWTDNAINETHFLLERSINGSTYTRIASLGANTVTFTDTGVTPGVTYHYQLRSVNATASSQWVRTSGSTQAPPSLINEDFSSGSENFTVIDGTWGITGGAYQITAANSASTTHLNNRAVHNTAVNGDFTIDVDASVAPNAGWADFAVVFGYQDASNYYFYSANQSNDTLTSGIFKVVGGVATELADAASIATGTTYHVRVVRAGNNISVYRDDALIASADDATYTSGQIGFGSKSDQATFDNLIVAGAAVAPPSTAPEAPSSLTATAVSSTRIDLTWTDNSLNEASFKIERSTDGGSTWSPLATRSPNTTSYTVNGLTAETTYHFRVRAYNVAGYSAYTTASATTTAAPQAGEKPGAHNTGPTRPDLLVASGSITTTHDGQIIENVNVTGEILVKHNNVIIRNFRLNATGYYGIRTFDTGANRADNVIIEDGEITGWAGMSAFYGPSATIRRINFHHLWADAIKPWRYHVIEGNWIHHLGMGAGQHADGIQLSGCVDVIIRGNNIDLPDGLMENGQQYLGNAAIFLNNAFGQSDNITIDGNWFNGGNYTIYSLSATNVRITNNFFGRTYNFGPKIVYGEVVWENNRFVDNGELINHTTSL